MLLAIVVGIIVFIIANMFMPALWAFLLALLVGFLVANGSLRM